jgi:hypothetical protein
MKVLIMALSFRSGPEFGELEGILGILAGQRLRPLDRVEDGGMVAPAQRFPNRPERAARIVLVQCPGNSKPGMRDALFAARPAQFIG